MMVAEEQIDVYQWNGMWTGVTKPKSEVHRDGDIHVCTHGVITDGEGGVIAQHRGPGVKLMRNVWDAMSIAGHLTALTRQERQDPGKWDLVWQAWRALGRECREELGYELPEDMLFGDDCVMFGITRTDQRTEDGWMDRTLSVNFMLVLPDIDPGMFELEQDKVLDVRWMHSDEIEQAVRAGVGVPLASRQPDNFHLLQGVVDCARRIQVVRQRRRAS